MHETLRNIRKSKGYTCEEMASLLGIKKSAYAKKERGEVIFSLPDAKKISDFFGKSIEEIFFAKKKCQKFKFFSKVS